MGKRSAKGGKSPAKPALWSAHVGERPYTVYLRERRAGGPFYLGAWDAASGNVRWRSLGHRDRGRAMREALAEQEAYAAGGRALAGDGPVTVAGVLALYVAHHVLPEKARAGAAEDQRRAAMWSRLYGDRAVRSLGLREWQEFIRRRSAGEIDAQGVFVPPEGRVVEKWRPAPKDPRGYRAERTGVTKNSRKRAMVRVLEREPRKPVGPRTVDADLVFLNAAFNWACEWTVDGRPLLERNPIGPTAPGVKRRRLVRPKSAKVRRPVATYDRYLAVRATAGEVTMRVPGAKGPRPSYLPELMDLVEQTGRRITAICRLWYSDFLWDGGRIARIRWRPLKGSEAIEVPVTDETRAVLERIVRERPGVGDVPVFPAPRARRGAGEVPRAMSRHLADEWLRRAEGLAGLAHLDGGSWHPYRRKWEVERKHHPEADVMAVQGRKDVRALRESYRLADDETMRAVVNESRKLRDSKDAKQA